MHTTYAAAATIPTAARPLRDSAPALARLFRAADQWLASMALDDRSRHIAHACDHDDLVRRERDCAAFERQCASIMIAQ